MILVLRGPGPLSAALLERLVPLADLHLVTTPVTPSSPAGLSSIPLDPGQPRSIRRFLQGTRCLVLAGWQEGLIAAQRTLLDAAVQAGVPRIVRVSPADPRLNRTAWIDAHSSLDQDVLDANGVVLTVAPSYQFLAPRGPGPDVGGAEIAAIDLRDAAAAMVVAITQVGVLPGIRHLTGPASIAWGHRPGPRQPSMHGVDEQMRRSALDADVPATRDIAGLTGLPGRTLARYEQTDAGPVDRPIAERTVAWRPHAELVHG